MAALPEITFDPSSQRLPQLSTGHLAPGAPAPTDPSFRSPLTPPPTPIISDVSSDKLTVSARHLQHHALQDEFINEYTLGDELGSGGFGFVVSATRNSDHKEVAVKFIFRDKVPVHGWAKDPELGIIPMEIYVLRNVQHPNIIGFLNVYQDFKYFYLVMELHGTPWSASNPLLNKNANNGPSNMLEAMAAATLNQQRKGSFTSSTSMSSFPTTTSTSSSSSSLSSGESSPIEAYEPPRPALLVRRTSCDLFECIEHHSKFSESQARMIFKQIVECVSYLNAKGICHRDIKDENIVIDNDFVVKLIDFGSAVIIPRPQGKLFDRFYGTINYASPEILKGEKYRAESAEVWSLGILLYTILYGEVPFNDPVQAISGPYIAPRVRSSNECLHLLNWMLAKTPDRRATIEDVAAHPWIAGLSMS
ncbi:MAG: kinase-like domain-containing protein [Podila humilis]|nr:MAG: kinase-like domain-containing protein [Podila humilis]